MIDWLNSNLGIAVSIFGIFVAAVVGIFGFVSNRRGRIFDEALAAKDATIELLRAQNETFARDIASYEAKQGVADEHNKLTDETISILHKRISELECNQFLEHDGKGHVVLKSQIAKMVR